MGLTQAGERADDKSIKDDEALYRRILNGWIVTEQLSGRKRLSSAAFKDSSREISVDRSTLTTVEDSWARAQGDIRLVGIASVTAGEARSLGQAVVHDPLSENIAHALICGHQPGSFSKQLAAMAKWAYPRSANPFT
jgi:hypothetical protein